MTQFKNALSLLTFILIVAYAALNSGIAHADNLDVAEACDILFKRKPRPGDKVSEAVALFSLAVVHNQFESMGQTQIAWKIAYRKAIDDIFGKVQHDPATRANFGDARHWVDSLVAAHPADATDTDLDIAVRALETLIVLNVHKLVDIEPQSVIAMRREIIRLSALNKYNFIRPLFSISEKPLWLTRLLKEFEPVSHLRDLNLIEVVPSQHMHLWFRSVELLTPQKITWLPSSAELNLTEQTAIKVTTLNATSLSPIQTFAGFVPPTEYRAWLEDQKMAPQLIASHDSPNMMVFAHEIPDKIWVPQKTEPTREFLNHWSAKSAENLTRSLKQWSDLLTDYGVTINHPVFAVNADGALTIMNLEDTRPLLAYEKAVEFESYAFTIKQLLRDANSRLILTK